MILSNRTTTPQTNLPCIVNRTRRFLSIGSVCVLLAASAVLGIKTEAMLASTSSSQWVTDNARSGAPAVKPGFFYRVDGNEDDLDEPVIGVYAKEVYYDSLKLTGGGVFNAAYANVYDLYTQYQNKKTVLEAVFFGVWDVLSDDGQEKISRVVEVPVCDNGRHKHWMPFKLQVHTETQAIDYLNVPKTGKDLIDNFIAKSVNTLQDKWDFPNKKLKCVGFHFLSILDACDRCLRKLNNFQHVQNKIYKIKKSIEELNNTQGNDAHPFNLEGGNMFSYLYELRNHAPDFSFDTDDISFHVTFTAKYTYGQSTHIGGNGSNFRDSESCSASMMFKVHPTLSRLGKTGLDNDLEGIVAREIMDTTQIMVRHQERFDISRWQDQSFIILKVCKGNSFKNLASVADIREDNRHDKLCEKVGLLSEAVNNLTASSSGSSQGSESSADS